MISSLTTRRERIETTRENFKNEIEKERKRKEREGTMEEKKNIRGGFISNIKRREGEKRKQEENGSVAVGGKEEKEQEQVYR